MNTIQIQCFLSAARTKNYSRTAEELLLEQPAVSRYIRRLEEELGVRLFTRQGRSMQLTAMGEKYYDLFYRFDAELRELSSMGKQQDALARTLRYTLASVWALPDILMKNQQNFQAKHPNVATTFVCCSYDMLEASVEDNSVDAVFHMSKYLEYFEDWEFETLTYLPNIVIYSDKHPMVLAGNPSFDGLDGSTILFLEGEINSDFAGENAKSYLQDRYHIRIGTQSVRDYETLISMVENGQGILMMDTWCHAKQFRNLRYLTTDRMEAVGIGWKKGNRNPAVRSFVEETKRFFAQKEGNN